jgi:hypothetical protein
VPKDLLTKTIKAQKVTEVHYEFLLSEAMKRDKHSARPPIGAVIRDAIDALIEKTGWKPGVHANTKAGDGKK